MSRVEYEGDNTETTEEIRESLDVHSQSKNEYSKTDALETVRSYSSSSSLENDNPFLNPEVAKYYEDLYEKAQYECRGAFDPNFEWTEEEEKKLIRKLDLRVALTACFLFVGLQVDRGNMQQAVSDNLLDDLGLTTNDYNTGNTIFLICFLLAELPSQLISKKLGPDIFIPIQMISWSLVAICQGAMTGKSGFYATRALIGMLEGGFIADLVLWLSYFYKSRELSLRLSWFWTTLSLVQIVTSLLAFAILRMRGVHGMSGWRWLFIIEGLVTLFIGIAGFYLMVPSAVQTKNKLHPKGWFTDREEKIVVNRVLRDDPSKGDMHNRKALDLKAIWKSLCDYDLWPIYIIGLITYIPTATITPYLTLQLKNLNFSTFDVNLLCIPYNVIHIIILLIITWVSERVNERSLLSLIVPLYSTPLLGLLRWWKGSGHSSWGTWVISTLILGGPYIHAICVSWVSRNSNSIRSRSVSSALYNMAVQLGNIAANNIYRADDAPLYHRGNANLFYISVAMFPMFLLTKAYYVWRNKSRDRNWKSMSEKEREDYIKYSKDEGNKRLDFRFDH